DEEEEHERRPHGPCLIRPDVDEASQRGRGPAPSSRRVDHVFSLVCQAASTSASRAAEIPPTLPESSAARSSGERELFHSNVARMVSSSGRKVRPLASARSMLRRLKPAVSPSGGTTIVMSRHGRIFCSWRNDHGTHVKRAFEPVTCLQWERNSPIGSGVRGPVAL